MMTLPADLYRTYDEAQTRVLRMRKEEGFHNPKRQQNNIGSRDSCQSSPEQAFNFGLLLGFAYGLQYDTKVPGKCFNNLEFTIIALDEVIQLWWLILLPEKTPKVILAFQDFIDLVSALYGNCQVQVFFETVEAILTWQGITGLLTRTIGGLQSELPFYITKATYSTDDCVVGESYGKIVQLIFSYSI